MRRKDDFDKIDDYDMLPVQERIEPGFHDNRDYKRADDITRLYHSEDYYADYDDYDDDDDEDEDYYYEDDLAKLTGKKTKYDTLVIDITPEFLAEKEKKRRQAIEEEEAAIKAAAQKRRSSGPPEEKAPEEKEPDVPEKAEEAPENEEQPHEYTEEELSNTQEITRLIHLPVPKQVMQIIELLKAHTYTAYLVGDCVNLMLLGERVMDFDIACNAELDRIIAIFDEKFKTREDLLGRGELIIINGAMGISVAPYRSRIDTKGKPVYCKTIDEDLRRRTFTSETVAYNTDAGIYDKFGGLSCIYDDRTILKAIGEDEAIALEEEQNAPTAKKKKSKEPPQRIAIKALDDNPESVLTAMLKFSRSEADISPYTLRYINENPELLDRVLPADINSNFKKILLSRRITDTLIDFRGVIFYLFPILREQYEYDQRSEYHEYTLYEHTARSVGYAFPDLSVRLSLLLHAIGKPDCAASRGDFNTYDGHAERAIMLSREILDSLELDERTYMRVLFLIRHHDDKITPDNAAEYSKHYGADMTRLLLLMQSANIRAKSSDPLNERVSASLRQLADSMQSQPQRPRRRGR